MIVLVFFFKLNDKQSFAIIYEVPLRPRTVTRHTPERERERTQFHITLTIKGGVVGRRRGRQKPFK